jgi:Fic-DOC domain mobile mystery protein B
VTSASNENPVAGDGGTPLDADESADLIPDHITTRADLNEWEAENIAHAHEWLSARRNSDVLDVSFLRELHRRMFAMTWTWAGTFRRTDKSISPYNWSVVPTLLEELVRDVRAQYDASEKTAAEQDEIAVRFHHGLVRIHPWPNGNGRHARLATDLLLDQWERPPFTWGGGASAIDAGQPRAAYIRALRSADEGDFSPLRVFVRS